MRAWTWSVAAAAAAATVSLAGCRSTPLPLTLERQAQAERQAADIGVQFTRSADAANRAVMADSDETSAQFARESTEAGDRAQHAVDTLRPLLEVLGYEKEMTLLGQFTERFARYRALDRDILSLAVENTNLKAQRLSFGHGQEEADAVRDAVRRVQSGSAADRALAAEALADVREVQVIQARHIAEADDAAMTRMEAQMAAAAASARGELTSLSNAEALAALDRFMAVNAQIVALSRRNSDVKSLAMSLGEKRMSAAACEEALDALRAALDAHALSATR